MTDLEPSKRRSVNPVETLILVVVFGIFGGSIYRLVENRGPVPELAQFEISKETKAVAASTIVGPSRMEWNCQSTGVVQTESSTVQFAGKICPDGISNASVIRTGESIGTVIRDVPQGTFSTDVITLNDGMNEIQIDGRTLLIEKIVPASNRQPASDSQ